MALGLCARPFDACWVARHHRQVWVGRLIRAQGCFWLMLLAINGVDLGIGDGEINGQIPVLFARGWASLASSYERPCIRNLA